MSGSKKELLHFVACAALSQGQVQGLWQAQHFRKVRYRSRGRRSTFAKVRHRLRGRRSTFARSGTDLVPGAVLSQKYGTDFAAGAALSQGQVQVQHFPKVRYTFRGRCSTLARNGAALSQPASSFEQKKVRTTEKCAFQSKNTQSSKNCARRFWLV